MSKSVQSHHPLARITIWHILLLALITRCFWAIVVPVAPIDSDPSVYDQLAQQIAQGKGYVWPDGRVTAYWPVGTSALYGIIFALFGHNLSVAALVNVLLGTGLVAATYALARTGFSSGVALIAALLTAIWPTWIAYTTIIASELPTNLFFTAGVAIALSRLRPWWLRVMVSTALLVASAYCRGNMLPFVMLVPLVVALRERSAIVFFREGALALALAALLIAPWALRNQHVLGHPVLIAANVGVNLWIGNNPVADGNYTIPPGPVPASTNEVERDNVYAQRAKAYIHANPGRYLALCLNRLRLALDRETYGVSWNPGLAPSAQLPVKIVMTGYWYLVFAAALIGIGRYLLRRWSRIFSPYILLPLATLAAPVLVMSLDRYHYALAPFVAIFAAYALVAWRNRGDGKSMADVGIAHDD